MALISSTTIYDDDNLTLEDLPESPPLLIFTSTIEDGSFVENDNGKNSFIMTKRLYNGVNKNKDVQSKVFVSYNNEGGRYNCLKSVIKKGIFSVVGKLKFSKNKMLHLIAQEIEWNLFSAVNKTTNNNNNNDDDDGEDELEVIENNYNNNNNKKGKKRKLLRGQRRETAVPIVTIPDNTTTTTITTATSSTSTLSPSTVASNSDFSCLLEDIQD